MRISFFSSTLCAACKIAVEKCSPYYPMILAMPLHAVQTETRIIIWLWQSFRTDSRFPFPLVCILFLWFAHLHSCLSVTIFFLLLCLTKSLNIPLCYYYKCIVNNWTTATTAAVTVEATVKTTAANKKSLLEKVSDSKMLLQEQASERRNNNV